MMTIEQLTDAAAAYLRGLETLVRDHVAKTGDKAADCQHCHLMDSISSLEKSFNGITQDELIEPSPTPIMQELRIVLNAAVYWSEAEADEEHPDPIGDACELIREASDIFDKIFPQT